MNFKDVKRLISEKLNWPCRDIYYITTDKEQFSYYLVYKNHRIKAVCAIDELNGLVSGVYS